MGQKSGSVKEPAKQVVKEIRRATRRQFSRRRRSALFRPVCAARTASPSCAGAKGSSRTSITAGRRNFWKLAGDTARAATSDEVKDLRREASALKEVVAELMLENRLLKKSTIGAGEDGA